MIEISAPPKATVGALRFQDINVQCALGRSGIGAKQREGDGVTPVGVFSLRELRYRADRVPRPITQLPTETIQPDDGWCDSPRDPNYNRLVKLPYPAGAAAETMWRDDHLYDALIVIGYNDSPVVKGAGSAIFLHLLRENDGCLSPTAGCIAVRHSDFAALASRCTRQTRIRIATC